MQSFYWIPYYVTQVKDLIIESGDLVSKKIGNCMREKSNP